MADFVNISVINASDARWRTIPLDAALQTWHVVFIFA
jgi:hypothetical protein